MSSVTLLQLRTAVRQETDSVGSLFCSDVELNGYIAKAYAALYGKIVQAFGNDYFVQTPAAGYTLTTDGINQLFALPTAAVSGNQLVFKVLGVEVLISGTSNYVSLKPFAFADRNNIGGPNGRIPQAGQTVRLLYVPFPTLPTADADVIDGVNSWEESIIIDASIVALAKEESDISAFLVRQKAMADRLDSEIENRNATEAGGRILDVTKRGRAGMQWRLNGNNLWLVGGAVGAYYPDDWDYYERSF